MKLSFVNSNFLNNSARRSLVTFPVETVEYRPITDGQALLFANSAQGSPPNDRFGFGPADFGPFDRHITTATTRKEKGKIRWISGTESEMEKR